jgi:hypothetical protein
MATFVVVACVFFFLWGALDVALGVLEMLWGVVLIVLAFTTGGRR